MTAPRHLRTVAWPALAAALSLIAAHAVQAPGARAQDRGRAGVAGGAVIAPRASRTLDLVTTTANIEEGERARGVEPAGPQLEVPEFRWEDHWTRFHLAEGVFSGLMGAVALSGYFMPEADGPARWRGGIVADDAVRRGLVLRSFDDRETAASASDGLLLSLTTLPVLVDALLTAWLLRDSSDVALQMLLMDMQAHAFAQGVTAIVKWAVRRERPLDRACREDVARRTEDPTCGGQADPGIADHSFFSGHTSLAFTSAALICLHHTELGLFGDEAADAAACATGIALASTVGALRIMADRHYLSDVAVGAGVGILSGWILPYLLHFASFSDARRGIRATIAPQVDTTQAGLNVVGTF